MQNKQKDKTLFASTIFLVSIYLAGIIGIHSIYKDFFLMLSPFNLLVSMTMIFLNHKGYNKSFLIFCFIIIIIGFIVEVIGVQTGIVFGKYVYGKTLGLKLFGVPIIIGINWLMLVYCAGVICHKIKGRIFLKSIIGATLLTFLDFFIEIVATKYDFWSWNAISIPIQNYIAWFVVSFLFLLLFNSLNFSKNNRLAYYLFIAQALFFISLTLF
ncbi:MAG: carotenoid biosynthesis protein [Bacteroidetes bacterium]|nr:carotenoid biosynthesis protein [Bacteroidota bacterium]